MAGPIRYQLTGGDVSVTYWTVPHGPVPPAAPSDSVTKTQTVS